MVSVRTEMQDIQLMSRELENWLVWNHSKTFGVKSIVNRGNNSFLLGNKWGWNEKRNIQNKKTERIYQQTGYKKKRNK